MRSTAAILSHPSVLICSDGMLSGRHPRGYGAFPRVLGRYVREKGVVTLEEPIAKMTGRSAGRLGLGDRGVVGPCRKADLVVFDPATIADRGTPADPAQSPVGIDVVIVNGEVDRCLPPVTWCRLPAACCLLRVPVTC